MKSNKIFEIIHKSKSSNARYGKIYTLRGDIYTPCFAPVGTQGAVKTLSSEDLLACGAQMILANAYHLYLRPGIDIIKKAGSLHEFMNWDKPILTDSGGYQVFSLADLRKVTDKGVEFQSHLDGSFHFLSPEDVIKIQIDLGSDIMMPLDECLHFPCEKDYAKISLKRTTQWAKRSKECLKINKNKKRQLLFGIIQGATYQDLRQQSASQLMDTGFDGYAFGGLSVGEPKNLTHKMIENTSVMLPEDKPRYFMGLGSPLDVIRSVKNGIDLFDCIMPTRLGRTGTAFTSTGKITVRNAEFKEDNRPLDEHCDCFVCKNYSRSYIRHLFNAKELSALRLTSFHNVYFYLKFMQNIRKALKEDKLEEFEAEFTKRYQNKTKGG
jgi:queuine tRNA-ribosyltransferase